VDKSVKLKNMARPDNKKKHLIEKYNELVWALAHQDYTAADIGVIMNRHRSVILRVISKKPREWTPKWVKSQ